MFLSRASATGCPGECRLFYVMFPAQLGVKSDTPCVFVRTLLLKITTVLYTRYIFRCDRSFVRCVGWIVISVYWCACSFITDTQFYCIHRLTKWSAVCVRPGMHKFRAPFGPSDWISFVGASYFQYNHCGFCPTYRSVYQFTCIDQKAPDNTVVHRSLQNCGSSVWNLLHVAPLTSRIWWWLMDIRKICGPPAPFLEQSY